MVEVSVGTLVLIALCTGFGNGIGTPLGNFLYKQYVEHHIQKFEREKVKEHLEKIKTDIEERT